MQSDYSRKYATTYYILNCASNAPHCVRAEQWIPNYHKFANGCVRYPNPLKLRLHSITFVIYNFWSCEYWMYIEGKNVQLAPPSPESFSVSFSIVFFPLRSHPCWALSLLQTSSHTVCFPAALHLVTCLHTSGCGCVSLGSVYVCVCARVCVCQWFRSATEMSLPVNSDYPSLERIARYRHACSNGSPYATNKPIDIKPRGRRG